MTVAVGDDFPVAGLIAQLAHPDAKARGAAAYYLGEKQLLPETARVALFRALDDRSPAVRADVVYALAKHQVVEILPTLDQGLTENRVDLRVKYLQAVGLLGDLAAPLVPHLIQMFTDRRSFIRSEAEAVLLKIGHLALPALVSATVDPESIEPINAYNAELRVLRHCIRTLGGLGKKACGAVPVLNKLLASENPGVAVLAGNALRKMNCEDQ